MQTCGKFRLVNQRNSRAVRSPHAMHRSHCRVARLSSLVRGPRFRGLNLGNSASKYSCSIAADMLQKLFVPLEIIANLLSGRHFVLATSVPHSGMAGENL